MRHDYMVVYQTIEDGWIMATVPELPGAVTQGATLEEARANIKDAVELLLQSYREDALRQAPLDAILETLIVDLPAS
jgi:predicted RNase H-like HicB family nuclease